MATIKVRGAKKLRRALAAAGPLATEALAAATFEEGTKIMKKSKDIVPVDLNILRNSGHTLPPKVSGTSVEVTMGYGGAAAKYAVAQHEELGYRHRGQQRAKYLEEPFLAALPTVNLALAASVRSHFERLKKV